MTTEAAEKALLEALKKVDDDHPRTAYGFRLGWQAAKNQVDQPVHARTTCNKKLQEQGEGYPRTCQKCGIGPCIGEPVKAQPELRTAAPEISNNHLLALANKCGLIGAFTTKELNDRVVGYARVVLNDVAVQEAFVRATPQPAPLVRLTKNDIDEMASEGVFLGNVYEISSAIMNAMQAKAQTAPDVRELVEAEPLYYLQDTRSTVGNCPLWWRENGSGYTTNLREAHKYTFEEAMRQHRCRETDLPWPCEQIDAIQRITVDVQYMGSYAKQRAALAKHGAAK